MIETIKIGPIAYKIEVVKDLKVNDDDGSVRQLAGYILYQDQVIKVEEDLPTVISAVNLLHECVHGMLYQGGLDKHAEEVSINLGYSLYALIRDNPDLIKFIQESE